MYIIMFSHAQLTTTLLLVLIFASKVSWLKTISQLEAGTYWCGVRLNFEIDYRLI